MERAIRIGHTNTAELTMDGRNRVAPYIVGLVGTHSSGKSTIANTLAGQLQAISLKVTTVNGVASAAHAAGMPILREHTVNSTLWIIATTLAREIEASVDSDVVIVDRAVPDALSYLSAALTVRGERLSSGDRQVLETFTELASRRYGSLIRTVLDPYVPIGANKRRDPDLDFRALVDRELTKVLAGLSVSHVTCEYGGLSQMVESTVRRIERAIVR